MNPDFEPHQKRIQRVGRLLWIFSWLWLIFNFLAMLIVVGTAVILSVMGRVGKAEEVAGLFMTKGLVPGVEDSVLLQILIWDYEGFQGSLGVTLFYAVFAGAFFVVTMGFILRIAASWKGGDVFGQRPIQSLRILGWLYLVHGILGQSWGVISAWIGFSNTMELIYFSFIRDVCYYTFSTSGSGIEWGLLALALSWILEHARLMREDQLQTI